MAELTHAQNEIMQQWIVQNSEGSAPSGVASIWPVFIGFVPDDAEDIPQNIIAILNTGSIADGRILSTGERIIKEAVQIFVRAKTFPVARAKAKSIVFKLDAVLNEALTLEGVNYNIQAVNVVPIADLGKDEKHRNRLTINATVTINQT